MSVYSNKDISLFYTEAKQARDRAYCPYSDHPVGVVLIDDQGQKSLGCNAETAHFKSICAEAGAISQMVVQGGQKIRDIFIVGPREDPVTPCGDCRQRIREFADENTAIYCFGPNGRLAKQYTIEDLLPESFGPENILNRKR